MDKELGAARKARWNKAFSTDEGASAMLKEDEATSINRKATIVLEHLIQASDVSHTMQHWHVYVKWNERLFHGAAYALWNLKLTDRIVYVVAISRNVPSIQAR